MTTQQFNQAVQRDIDRLIKQGEANDKAKPYWPSIAEQQAYWRDRDANLDRVESACQWFDQQGEKQSIPF